VKPLLALQITVSYGNNSPVLRNASLELQPGEVLGLAGRSGSGKSTLGMAALNLLDPRRANVSGFVQFGGRNLLEASEREMRALRGKEIGLVFQSPASSLNPMLSIGSHLREAWRAHRRDSDGAEEIATALFNVGLPSDPKFLRRRPSQISIGQGQRVLIAMAVLHRPQLLICDEPTSALDLITQAEILDLFRQLNRELSMAMLFISHDLLAMAEICDRIALLHDGSIIECAATDEILHRPRHPYTRQLISSLPLLKEQAAKASF
jgi:ABC-type glutathione transport system ATPase component